MNNVDIIRLRFKQSPFLVDDDNRTASYEDIGVIADKLLSRFDALSLGRKSLVFLCVSNSINSVSTYFGLLERGHAVLLLDAAIHPENLENLVSIYGPAAVFHPDRDDPLDLLKNAEHPVLHPELSVMLSTSGSTGSPKLVCFSWQQLMANAQSIVTYLGITQTDIPFAHLPFHYSYGLSVLHSHFLAGAKIRLSNHSIMQREFWEAMRSAEVTSFSGVPFNYEMMKRLRFPHDAVTSLTTLTQAGGRLSAELVREFGERAAARNQRFVVMYGQTEAGPRISYLPADKAVSHAGSIGIPIPGVRIELDGGHRGEVVVHSPSIMLGYAQTRADLALGDRMQGVLATGDIAEVDSDGYFRIVGRSSRFLKIQGNRVGLDDVEAVLKSDGLTAACVGLENWLCVAVEKEEEVAVAKALLTLKLKIPPRSVEVRAVGILPRNPYGKVLYKTLLDQVIGDRDD